MTDITTKKIVLASASPRRRKLLKGLGLTFEIIPSRVDEIVEEDVSFEDLVKILAKRKAEDVAEKLGYPAIVIGCDTTVIVDDILLGKPVNYDDAFRMLKMLSGRPHKVISGIAVLDNKSGKTVLESVTSEVYFKELTDNEIDTYIRTVEPMDKAGSYAIQGLGSVFVTGIKGCYFNVVGLPVYRLCEILKEFQIDVLALNLNSKGK